MAVDYLSFCRFTNMDGAEIIGLRGKTVVSVAVVYLVGVIIYYICTDYAHYQGL